MIATLIVGDDTHPAEVTVKLWVPVARPEMMKEGVDPAIAPGLIVQLPAGNPLNSTLPVVNAHVGWVISPTVGAVGIGLTVTAVADDDTL